MKQIVKGVLFVTFVVIGARDASAWQCKTLPTTMTTNNQGSINGQFFFDLTVNPASGITVDSMAIDCNTNTLPGTAFTMSVWTTAGGYVGKENNMAAWTQVSSGPGVVAGTPIYSPVDLTDFPLAAGTWGVALILNGTGHRYTNGTATNLTYSNAELTMVNGAALNTPWAGTPFTPRVLNGSITYDCLSVTTFCTAKGTLACGTPAIGFAGLPSATSGSGFTVSASPARTCKAGILLYNTTSASPGLPFQGGTLCIDPMGLRRAGPTDSMGTPGGANCDGKFSLDMNAFSVGAWVVPDCAGAPSGLPPNNPAAFLATPGQDIYTTYWGRDSVATGSFVSNGLKYTQGP